LKTKVYEHLSYRQPFIGDQSSQEAGCFDD
jgi:hypothetical protein